MNLEENDTFIEKISKADDIHRSGIFNNDIHSHKGWIKVNSTGKGFHILVPLNLFKINTQIPTPQYHNYNPLKIKIDMFVTLIVYHDTNANTTLTISRTGETIYIEGSHSLLVGMIKIPSMNLLRQLLDDGIIDGNQLLRRFFNNKFMVSKPPLALILSNIIKRINKGDPIIDISDGTNKFLETLHGVAPRYNGKTPIFDTPLVNYLRDKLRLAQKSIPLSRYFLVFFSSYFWNRMPIRTSFLHFEMPQQLLGYTPCVWWSESPMLLPFVKRIQDHVPDIFYDGR